MGDIRHIWTFFIITVIITLSVNPLYGQSGNPFLSQIGKSFGEYHDLFMTYSDTMLRGTPVDQATLNSWMSEAASLDPTKEWSLLARLNSYRIRSENSLRNSDFRSYSPEYSAEDYISDLISLSEDGERYGIEPMKIAPLFYIAEALHTYVFDYERAFTYYFTLDSWIENIKTIDFPPRQNIYQSMGALYYKFEDYDKAIFYFSKIAEDPVWDNYYNMRWHAYNGLALCYRNKYSDFEKSNYYFSLIFEKDHNRPPVWEWIAKANIGYNYYLQNDYETALPLLLCAENIKGHEDFPFIAERTVIIADIYLKWGNLTKAKEYLDATIYYLENSPVYPINYSKLYSVMSKYYSITGNNDLADSYLDSVLVETKRQNDAFSGLKLMHAEQKLNIAQRRIMEEEIHAHKVRSRIYFGIATIAVIMFAFIFALFIYRRLYHKKREILAQKAAEWVSSDKVSEKNMTNNEASRESFEYNRLIMEQVFSLMASKQLYKDPTLSLDSLATLLNVSRNALSKAINDTTGKNFNQFINDYRIREAISIITNSDQKYSNVYINELFEDVGFASRTPFYMAFKKVTGLSPTEYIAVRDKS